MPGLTLKNPHVAALCEYFGVRTLASVGFHHEAVVKIERKHLDIKRRLKTISDSFGTDWEQRLPGIVFSLNNETSSTTGFSPFFVYFLRHPHRSVADLSRAPTSQYSDDYVPENVSSPPFFNRPSNIDSAARRRSNINMIGGITQRRRHSSPASGYGSATSTRRQDGSPLGWPLHSDFALGSQTCRCYRQGGTYETHPHETFKART